MIFGVAVILLFLLALYTLVFLLIEWMLRS